MTFNPKTRTVLLLIFVLFYNLTVNAQEESFESAIEDIVEVIMIDPPNSFIEMNDCNFQSFGDFDCPDLGLNFGDPCDDGNTETTNDMVNCLCSCEGSDGPDGFPICPDDIFAEIDFNECSAFVIVETPNFSPEFGIPINDYNGTSDASDFYLVGTTPVNWTMEDCFGIITNCVHYIYVFDEQPPMIECQSSITYSATEDQCSLEGPIELGGINVEDACGISSIENDAPEMFPVGTYEVTWFAMDNYGNQSTCITSVIVEDDQLPEIICPFDTTIYAQEGLCTALLGDVEIVEATDNCGLLSVLNDFNNSTNMTGEYEVGINSVSWTAIDINDNEQSCITNVTVIDLQSPEILCGDDVMISYPDCLEEIEVEIDVPAFFDNCDVVSLVNDLTESDETNIILLPGNTILTWTVMDLAGNADSCSQEITLIEGFDFPDMDEDDIPDLCDHDIDGDGDLNEADCDPINSEIYVGAICDDNDAETFGDTILEDCSCEGTVGISDFINESQRIEIYPNPSEGFFFIKDPMNRPQLQYELHNVLGDVLLSGSLILGDKIYLNHLSIGLYYLKVWDEQKLIGSYKVLKDK